MAKGQALFIVAASARALASSAACAGFQVHALDLFADLDTVAASQSCTRIEGTLSQLDCHAVCSNLERIDPDRRLAVVFGGVVDQQFELLAQIGRHRRVYGTQPAVLARLYDPVWRQHWLIQQNVAHPQTQLNAPASPVGWLSKQRSGSGGQHIETLDHSARADSTRSQMNASKQQAAACYYQRRLSGLSLSVTVLVNSDSISVIGYADQTPERAPQSLRYSGAIELRDEDWSVDQRQRVEAIVQRLASDTQMRGLVSFDFLLDEQNCWLLEINPRPSANFELFDHQGALFQSHIDACRGRFDKVADGPLPVVNLSFRENQRLRRGFSVVYARQSTVVRSGFRWPIWARDRPRSGTNISIDEPLCTVHAQHTLDGELRRLLTERQALIHSGISSVEQ